MSFPVVRGMRSLELGQPGPVRTHLNALVLRGEKVACFGQLAEYADENEHFERVGEQLALVDDNCQWIGTVEVVATQLLRAREVRWAHVEAEGEGFASVAEWRERHIQYWASENLELADETQLIWLRYRLVDPLPPGTPASGRPTAGDLELPEGYRWAYSGKVRDLFTAPDGNLLFVASDRISAYDHILPTSIPGKGEILTQLALWWFARMDDLVGNHVLPIDPPPSVARRAMLAQQLSMLPVECVARGYLSGSGLADYARSGAVCGHRLPAGLVEGSRLPEPIFTPATKAALGDHDENVDFAGAAAIVGPRDAKTLRRLTLELYRRAAQIAGERGIILADTKLEFGRAVPPLGSDLADDQSYREVANDGIVLGDELLTPDSSRFWPADRWQPGQPQPSFDKQYVRDWLRSPASGWSSASSESPPPLPPAVVERTRELYVEAYQRLTGLTWQ